ncbi:MAG: rod-binding protein [Ruegeria sp.]|uniref:rod-binding protein n=1 Tax=Ruegeria sp. TaxID=1879320 RepID=UPI00349E7015
MKIPPPSTATAQAPPTPTKHEALRDAAVELEAAFLSEMLRSAGLGKAPEAFGGGAGEDQFASMLVRQQAEQLARAGGIGLSETLFNALMESGNDT